MVRKSGLAITQAEVFVSGGGSVLVTEWTCVIDVCLDADDRARKRLHAAWLFENTDELVPYEV